MGATLGEPRGELFHVFLSHASEHKQGFVDFLAAEFEMRFPAVKVFVDEFSLEAAGRAMDNIHAALQDAFVVVVVLSKEFISKKYPMEELHLLLERDRLGSSAKVLPVFYDASTDDIGQKQHEYAAMTGDPQKQQWARDLELLGKMTGIRPDQVANIRDVELTVKVIKETARLLFADGHLPMQKRQDLPASLVALDPASDPLVALLTAEGSRKMVLLHGMVGSGKSTRARAVFNYLHAHNPTVPCCFLDLGYMEQGLEEAQRRMLRELAFLSGDVGSLTLEAGRQLVADGLLRGTRVLLVVDNVWKDQLEQLLPRSGWDARSVMELLGEGSMVLVTSRDLTGPRHFGGGAFEEVQMGYLEEAEAWELFCKLMGEGSSLQDPDVEAQMRRVLERCGGVPLAIEECVKQLQMGNVPKVEVSAVVSATERPLEASASITSESHRATSSRHPCRVYISHAGEETFVAFLLDTFKARFPFLEVLDDRSSGGRRAAGTQRNAQGAMSEALVVVVLLTKQYICTPAAMEELHLLLERSQQASELTLLPVLCGDSPARVAAQLVHCMTAGDAAAELLLRQRAGDLRALLGSTSNQRAADLEAIQKIMDALDVAVADAATSKGAVLQDGAVPAGLYVGQVPVAYMLQRRPALQGWGTDLPKAPASPPSSAPPAATALTAAAKESEEDLQHKDVQTGPELVEHIVGQTVQLLADLRQLPAEKDELLPSILVGLDAMRADVSGHFAPSDKNRRMLLLHGMGGIGKTTLAKCIFNQLHERDRTVPCCFLQLDASLQSPGALLPAQRVLLRELSRETASDEASAEVVCQLLEDKLRGVKVLLVVDNVWGDQLQWLLPGNIMGALAEGSMMLVTSRDARACDGVGELRWVHGVVEMEVLPELEAMELLCRHAYGTRAPPEGEEDFVRQVVARCGGLPMALEVVGRHLRVANQEQFLEGLEEALAFVYRQERAGRLEEQQTLFGAVQVSWNTLSAEERAALLDVVWLLRGQPWELVATYCNAGVLERLRSLALVAKGQGEVLIQQDVQVHEAIVEFYKSGVSIPKGQRLELRGDSGSHLSVLNDLQTADIARGLKLRECKLDGEGSAALSKLKQLRLLWLECGSEAGADVVLELASTSWLVLQGTKVESGPPVLQGQSTSLQLQEAGCLSVLVLKDMPQLQQVQGLQACTALQAVWIAGCDSLLQNADLLVGLPALQHLWISGCGPTRALPGLHPSLQQLVLDHCRLLEKVDVNALSALTSLEITWCGNLRALDCKGRSLPLAAVQVRYCTQLRSMNLDGLAALTVLKVDGNMQLQSVDASSLSAVQHLAVRQCRQLTALELTPSRCEALTTLEVKRCENLQTLGLQGLTALQQLEVTCRWALREIASKGELGAVTSLVVSEYEEQLQEEDVAGLTGLQRLEVSKCSEVASLDWTAPLHGLTALEVAWCDGLRAVGSKALAALQQLKVDGCGQLRELEALGGLRALTALEVRRCEELQKVDLGGLSALLRLEISHCGGLREVAGLTCLGVLERWLLRDCRQLPGVDVWGLGTVQARLEAQGPSGLLQAAQSVPTEGAPAAGPSRREADNTMPDITPAPRPAPLDTGAGPSTPQETACKGPTGTQCHVFVSLPETEGTLKSVLASARSWAGHSPQGNQPASKAYVEAMAKAFKDNYPRLKVVVDGSAKRVVGDAAREQRLLSKLEDAPVVVVVVTKEYIGQVWPMQKLHQLLKWREHGSDATLLPVFSGVTRQDIVQKAEAYKNLAADGIEQKQWAKDLLQLADMPGISTDQPTALLPLYAPQHALEESSPAAAVAQQAAGLLIAWELSREQRAAVPGSVQAGRDTAVLVGAAREKERLLRLLAGAGPPSLVLLHGEAGIGKTALARAVYDQLREKDAAVRCCFLELDRDVTGEGLVPWQCTLLEKLAGATPAAVCSALQGQESLAAQLRGKRVLVVVDNAGGTQLEQLLPGNIMGVLGAGSVVLVTSREPDACLKAFGGGQGVHVVHVVALEPLSEQESMELFCRHAFGSSTPPAGDQDRVLRMMAWCGALPLTLEMAGRCFASLQRKALFWSLVEDAVSSSGGALELALPAVLQLSWQTLAAAEQDALLDIVWFLRGQPWEVVASFCGTAALSRLQALGLVMVGEEDGKTRRHAMVHDAVTAFCRSKVRREGDMDSQKRLVLHRDVVGGRALADAQDLVGLQLHGWQLDAPAYEELLRLQSLGLLWLEGGRYPVAPALVQPRLRWLWMEGAGSNPGTALGAVGGALLEKGVANPPEDLSAWSLSLQGMPELRVLVLQKLPQLDRLQHLEDCKALRVLWIRRCKQLEAADLRDLTALEQLEVSSCEELKVVAGLGHLSALQQLNVQDCQRLCMLDGLAGLTTLVELRIGGCSTLRELSGLKDMRALKQLQIQDCQQLEHMDALQDVNSLVRLTVRGCPRLMQLAALIVGSDAITQAKITQAKNLLLGIGACVGRDAPAMLSSENGTSRRCSKLAMLQAVDMSHCPQLQSLPNSFGQLSALNTLDLSHCPQLKSLPKSFGQLSALQALNLGHCLQLQLLPESFGKLAALRRLDLSHCTQFTSLPDSFGQLQALTSLDISCCTSLKSVPASVASLRLDEFNFLSSGVSERQRAAFGGAWDPARMDAFHETNVAAVLAQLDLEYTLKIVPIMDKLQQWRAGKGDLFSLLVFKDAQLREEAVNYMLGLRDFWHSVQRHLEASILTAAQFFTHTWLGRAREYRLLGEQLDIADWYWKDKHIDFRRHYIDGLDAPDEYMPAGADGKPAGVKGNRARSLLFKMIQEEELHQCERGKLPAGSLELARQLKALGTSIRFQDEANWPADLKQQLLSSVQIDSAC